MNKTLIFFCLGLNMTAGYVGQTAEKVTEILNSARGCVLFIDEAYGLGKSSFGVEAMNTLLAAMTDTKNYKGMVVIIAGYKSDLNEMLARNEGLRSRFSNVIDFPDWNSQDCVNFLTQTATKENFQLDEETKTVLNGGFEELIHRPGRYTF
jgi:AAA+ superfamily predicted ATPase